jgi:D-tyrosyl-tRNA(Tyr) deacylase
MRVLIQRVTYAAVAVVGKSNAEIQNGLLVFVGMEDADNDSDVTWASNKIVNLRIFNDENNLPNLSLLQTGGDLLLVSQFTLHALTKKGNRPSYIKASRPEFAEPLYLRLIQQLTSDLGKEIKTGTFGADMKVSLLNDGPVTIWIDTQNKE